MRLCPWQIWPVNRWTVGKYPPLAIPVRSLPKRRMGGEGGQASSTQPRRSGRVRISKEILWPNL